MQEFLVASMRIHVQTEISTLCYGMGGISIGQNIYLHTYWAIDFLFCPYGDIIQVSPYLVTILQIGMNIDLTTERNIHWLIGNLQLIHIGMAHICHQCSLQLLGISQGIHGDVTIQQLIPTIQLGMNSTVGNLRISHHVMQLILVIMYLVNLGFRHQSGSRRQEISTHALCLYLSRKGVEILVRQEMLGLNLSCLQLCLISQAIHIDAAIPTGLGIDGSIHLHASLTFGKSQSSGILRSIHLHISLNADAARDADFLCQGRIEHGCYHTEIVGTCLQIDIRLQTIHICHISYHAIRA